MSALLIVYNVTFLINYGIVLWLRRMPEKM